MGILSEMSQVEIVADASRLVVEACGSIIKGEIGYLFLGLVILEVIVIVCRAVGERQTERRNREIERRVFASGKDECKTCELDEAARMGGGL